MTRPAPPRCSSNSPAPGRSDVPVSESTRQPSTSKTQQSTAASASAAHRIFLVGVGGKHYWYTLFPMKHPWDQRLGFWYIADQHPDLPAVVACPSDVTLTFGELAGRAHQLVHGLRAQGLGAGDIFAYALPNDVDMLYWQLAAQEGGFQSIALNPALSGAEIQRIVDHSEAAAIVVHARLRGPGGPDGGHRLHRTPDRGRRGTAGLHVATRRSSKASRPPSPPTADWASPSPTPRARPASPRRSSGRDRRRWTRPRRPTP